MGTSNTIFPYEIMDYVKVWRNRTGLFVHGVCSHANTINDTDVSKEIKNIHSYPM